MISVNNISKEFGGEALFKTVSFNISSRERIGLAGKNGAGKSTLLNLLSKELLPDEGEVVISKELNVGYLKQEMKNDSMKSVIEESLSVFSFLDKKKERQDEIGKQLSVRTDYESKSYLNLIDELDQLNHELSVFGVDKLRGKTEIILKGLGFQQNDFHRKLNEFSHGWRMRVEIAKLLLQNPALLLLDEPTNHLDIESIQWLEDYLQNYSGSVVLVSHDRTLLDRITTRTIEINNGSAYDYKVPYSEYIVLREERENQLLSSYNNQQKQLKEIERFIERFRYKASKAKQVQSRVKQLEKVDRVEIDKRDSSSIHFSFPEANPSGKIVYETIDLRKSYGKKLVLDGVDIKFIKGEKVALVGKNGEGKSTMAKIITAGLQHEGELKKGHNVITGYYSQDIWEMLDPDETVFETIDNVAVGDVRTKIKAMLGAFLFQGDDIDKKVKILSGGEKSRLALVKLLLSPTNVLILDEPTNHLDILAKDILKNALLQYHGTVIIVSHDRDFLSGLTDRCLEFSNHKVKEYLGDISYFLEKLKQRKQMISKGLNKETTDNKVSDNKVSWAKKKESDKKLRKINKQIEVCEKEISSLEESIEKLNIILANPDHQSEEFKSGELFRKHDQLNKQLEDVYQKWDELHKEVEEIEN